MSELKFFCFGKNGFCDDAYKDGTCEKCKNMDWRGGEMRPVPEPPRLDRSAWEPCEWCGEWIGFDCRPKEQDVGYRLYAGFCKQVAADDFWEDETENLNFCPICGRPLTDAAWEMLEKRLEGRE